VPLLEIADSISRESPNQRAAATSADHAVALGIDNPSTLLWNIDK
jgi:hypothetical protein